MVDRIIRLLFTEEPYSDESFAGYLLRLGELNFVERLSWILKASNLNGKLNSTAYPGISSKENLGLLARLTGMNEKLLNSLTYKINWEIPNRANPRYILFGFSIPAYFILSKHLRICPLCLKQANYLRRIWEFAPITVCSVHNCRLLDICPYCQNYLLWNRRNVSVCDCGCDWRNAVPITVPDSELRIAANIFRLTGEFAENNNVEVEAQIGKPIKHLGLLAFLKVLLFFTTAFAGLSKASGKVLFRTVSNTELHQYLNSALMIFDNYPRNFFIFLDWVKQQSFPSGLANSPFSSKDGRASRKKQSIEKFGIIFTEELFSTEYDFLHEDFSTYLKFGDKGYVNDLLFSHNPKILSLLCARLIKTNKSICTSGD